MHCAVLELFAENATCLEQKRYSVLLCLPMGETWNRKARNCLCFPQDSIKEEGAELFEEKTPFGENKKNLDDIKKVGKKNLSL